MVMSESIYEGVVEPYYKNPTRVDANRAGQSSQNIGESASSPTHYSTSESAGKCRKLYVDRLLGESKICLI